MTPLELRSCKELLKGGAFAMVMLDIRPARLPPHGAEDEVAGENDASLLIASESEDTFPQLKKRPDHSSQLNSGSWLALGQETVQ